MGFMGIKRSFFLLVLTGMLLLLVSASAEGWVTAEGEESWIHALPDELSEILGVAEKDASFFVFGEENNGGSRWLRVEYQHGWGYLSASKTREMTENLPETPKTPAYAEPSRRESVNSCYGYVSSENVNFRKSPSLSAGRVGILKQYALCRILGKEQVDKTTWYRVSFGEKTGWLSGGFFRQLSVAELKKYVSSERYPTGLKLNNVSGKEAWNFDYYLPANIDSGNISLKVAITLSENAFSAPAPVEVKVTVGNIDATDLPGPVELFDPSGHKIREFGDPVLKAGESRAWNGAWNVSEDDLAKGKLTWRIRYVTFDETGEKVQKVLGFSKKITLLEPEEGPVLTERPSSPAETLSETEKETGEETAENTEETPIANRWGRTSIARTNMRENPDIKSKRVGQIRKAGNLVWILEETRTEAGETWYRILINHKEGWILSDYVRPLSVEESGKLKPPAESQKKP